MAARRYEHIEMSARVSPLGVVSLDDSDPTSLVIRLQGEHDVSSAARLLEVLTSAVAANDADVVIDLSGVDFMGAATVGVIVQTHVLLRLRSRTLVLRAPSTSARRILNLCGLSHLIESDVAASSSSTGKADSLGTWVEIPATERSDRPKSVEAPAIDDRTTDSARRGGP